MNVLLFGATGMVGDGVLHECLADSRVTAVLAVDRSPLGMTHSKLRESRRTDFLDYTDLAGELKRIDACFFCLGVSAAGMLLALPLKAFMFRPGFIRPRPGKASKTLLYRAIYAVAAPLYPLLKLVAGKHVTTTENLGRAMIAVATVGYSKRILENPDINSLGGG
jgi:hypothetical protein